MAKPPFATLPLVSREITSEERAQKFHNDDVTGSTSNWKKHISRVGRPITSTFQTWVETRHQYERFDWFIERLQTRVAFGWLSERSGECPRSL